MGATSVGVNLDAASVLTNPAGYTPALGGRVDFGASYFKPDVKLETGGTEYTSDKKASPIPALGLAIPLTDSTSLGLGAYGVSGMGVDYNLGGGALLYTSYSQMRFAPGVAYKINNMISVGATVNVMYAQMAYSMNMGAQAVDMDASSFGYGATIGVTVKPIDIVTVGVAYETKSIFQDFKLINMYQLDRVAFQRINSS